MSEIFLKDDITSLLENRFIVVIGDSIQRAVYKDIVLLLQKNQYLTDSMLRRKSIYSTGANAAPLEQMLCLAQYLQQVIFTEASKGASEKGEITFSGDKLIEGGQLGEISNGVGYREVRQYQTDYHLVRFYFVTRCYNNYVESLLKDLSDDPLPDVVLMNSCLWDISRYGKSSVDQYKKNIKRLFERFRDMLPPTCLIIWNSTLPISKRARGGFLIPGVEFMNSVLRLDILEANFFVHKLAVAYGFDVLDLHYYLRHQLQRRAGDGVHWDTTAHRRITNLILTHVAEAWDVKSKQHARQHLSQTFNRNVMMNNQNQFAAQSPLSLLPDPVPSLGMFANSYSNNANSYNRKPTPFGNKATNTFTNQVNAFNNQLSPVCNQANAIINQFNDFSYQNKALNNQMSFNNNNNNIMSVDYQLQQQHVGLSVQYQLQQQHVGQVPSGYEENCRQSEFINRYGGPIRRGSSAMDGNQSVGLENDEGQFRWEPYENRHFNPNLSGNMYSDRMRPYRGKMGNRVNY